MAERDPASRLPPERYISRSCDLRSTRQTPSYRPKLASEASRLLHASPSSANLLPSTLQHSLLQRDAVPHPASRRSQRRVRTRAGTACPPAGCSPPADPGPRGLGEGNGNAHHGDGAPPPRRTNERGTHERGGRQGTRTITGRERSRVAHRLRPITGWQPRGPAESGERLPESHESALASLPQTLCANAERSRLTCQNVFCGLTQSNRDHAVRAIGDATSAPAADAGRPRAPLAEPKPQFEAWGPDMSRQQFHPPTFDVHPTGSAPTDPVRSSSERRVC